MIFFLETLADRNFKMTFLARTTFFFGSWICQACEDGKLQSRLVEQQEFDDEVKPAENQELIEKVAKLSIQNQGGKEEEYVTKTEKETDYDFKYQI